MRTSDHRPTHPWPCHSAPPTDPPVAPPQRTADISITIIDDDVEEPDEHFTISLSEPSGGETDLDDISQARVTIINDDFPGTFHLPVEDVAVSESASEVRVMVYRLNGCSGQVSLEYCTKDGTASAGSDYAGARGTLTWAHGDVLAE